MVQLLPRAELRIHTASCSCCSPIHSQTLHALFRALALQPCALAGFCPGLVQGWRPMLPRAAATVLSTPRLSMLHSMCQLSSPVH